jgi:hypothetical protein
VRPCFYCSYFNNLLRPSFRCKPSQCASLWHKLNPFRERQLSGIICKINQCASILLVIEHVIFELNFEPLIFIYLLIVVPSIVASVWLVIVNLNCNEDVHIETVRIGPSDCEHRHKPRFFRLAMDHLCGVIERYVVI